MSIHGIENGIEQGSRHQLAEGTLLPKMEQQIIFLFLIYSKCIMLPTSQIILTHETENMMSTVLLLQQYNTMPRKKC